MLKPFKASGDTITLACTTASAETAALALPANASQVRIHNAGPNMAFGRFANATRTAAVATDVPFPVGVIEVQTKDGATFFAAICAAGTATIYLTPGEGE